jgi:hypothetical protein
LTVVVAVGADGVVVAAGGGAPVGDAEIVGVVGRPPADGVPAIPLVHAAAIKSRAPKLAARVMDHLMMFTSFVLSGDILLDDQLDAVAVDGQPERVVPEVLIAWFEVAGEVGRQLLERDRLELSALTQPDDPHGHAHAH